MSKKLDEYLGNVAHQLRALPAKVREAEVREMRLHLEQLRDDFVAQGQNPEMAAQAALSQFGDARAVGVKVRDVWEGQDFGWRRVLAAFLFGLLFWGGAMVGLMFGSAFQFWPQSALFPQETWLFLVAASLLIPTVTGAIHSFHLGRRAWMMSVAAYVPLWIAEIVFHQGPSISYGDYKTSFWAWSLVWGISGACLSDLWRRRQRYTALALAGSTSSASISPRDLPRASRRKANWKKLAILVVLLALGMDAKWRLDPALHPQTAGEAVQTQLLLARDATKFAPPDPIVIEEVTPTAAEVAAGTQRVRFHAVYHATKEYRKRRLDFLQTQLASRKQRKLFGEAALRASLQRVRVNAYSIRGVVKVKKTPHKWQVEAESFDWSRLNGWIEDIYFAQ